MSMPCRGHPILKFSNWVDLAFAVLGADVDRLQCGMLPTRALYAVLQRGIMLR